MNSPENIFERYARTQQEGRSARRISIRELIESMIVELRPDYHEADEIIDALKVGLEGRFLDDLPLEVEYAINDLKKAMDSAYLATYEPDAYDSIGECAGFDHDNLPYEEKE